MATIAVKVTDLNSECLETKQGILVNNPSIDKNCLIYLGSNKYFTIYKIKGWIGLADGNYIIIFDAHGKRFRVEVLASSQDFLV